MRTRRSGLWCLTSLSTALAGCVGGSGTPSPAGLGPTPPATLNTLAVPVDAGPAAATGAFNHAYVTVKICAAGSATQCASIDHVLLDTGSVGLRLVRSVLDADKIGLTAETDGQGRAIDECMSFAGGQTWGAVALADVHMAGETASGIAVQVMNDTTTGAPAPAACGANGPLLNGVAGFSANGLLGVGVFVEDCGPKCVSAQTPLPVYYGCTAAGACSAENLPLNQQVTNPVASFATDNNGIIVDLPPTQNANGDASLQGQLLFGIATQADNVAPPAGLTVLGTDTHGDFTATYNGSARVMPALVDSGVEAFSFDDPTIAVCTAASAPNYVGYYCPATAPLSVFAVNSGVGVNNMTGTVAFALANPATFTLGAAALGGLGNGGGASTFTWGMPFFYGRKVYIGIDQRAAGDHTGPYFAY